MATGAFSTNPQPPPHLVQPADSVNAAGKRVGSWASAGEGPREERLHAPHCQRITKACLSPGVG